MITKASLQDILDADAARRMSNSVPILTEAGRNILSRIVRLIDEEKRFGVNTKAVTTTEIEIAYPR